MYTLKKSLGQHFLRDENICRKIMEALAQRPFSRLLEVGPGGGALTKHLLKLPEVDLKCVELDEEKVNWLLHTYPEIKGRLINADFLQIPVPFDSPFTIVGNFPYNISTQILFRVLEWKGLVETMVGMFQKEVALRVASAPGNKVYGVLSVLIQAFFETEYLFDVHEGSFQPPPKVKSGVIRLTPRENVPPMKSEAHFTRLVKAAFNQRRKTLRNATRALFTEETLANSLFDRRAEQLSVAEFAALTFTMS